MLRKLKSLGLVLMATMAVGAAASAASAQAVGTLTSDGPVTQIGALTGEPSANAITAFGGEIRCPSTVYTGHKTNSTPHEMIPSGATSATVTPHFGVCTGLGFPSTVDMNGCDLVFNFGETSGAHSYAVTVNVVCPAGKDITVTIFGSANKHTSNEPFCHFTITEKETAYAGLTTTDTTTGTLDTTGTVSGITMDRVSPTGSILCPSETTNAASLKANVSLEGKNAEGKTTAMSISE